MGVVVFFFYLVHNLLASLLVKQHGNRSLRSWVWTVALPHTNSLMHLLNCLSLDFLSCRSRWKEPSGLLWRLRMVCLEVCVQSRLCDWPMLLPFSWVFYHAFMLCQVLHSTCIGPLFKQNEYKCSLASFITLQK